MNHLPRKRFGQNFLQDEAIIHAIIRGIHPNREDHMIEIGPGLAALTTPLMEHLHHPLHVVEIDRDIVQKLRTQFDSNKLVIHQADALQFDFSALQKTLGNKKIRIVGNLPYNISTPLLFHLIRFHQSIIDMHFMLQKEVVERLIARPNSKDYGRLSVMLQYHCNMDKILDVPPTAFYPAPKVDSAVIRIHPYAKVPYPAKNEIQFAKLVTKAFSQRRKTLKNNLRTEITDGQFTQAFIDPSRRPETLSVEEFIRLANILET